MAPYLAPFQGEELSSDLVSEHASRTQSFLQKFVDDSSWRRIRAQAFAKDRDRLEILNSNIEDNIVYLFFCWIFLFSKTRHLRFICYNYIKCSATIFWIKIGS